MIHIPGGKHATSIPIHFFGEAQASFLVPADIYPIAHVHLEYNAPLITNTAPSGIVSYELASNPANSNKILSSWNQDARMHAALSLGLDYLFMVVYAAAISLGCVWAMEVIRSRSWPLAALGAFLAWGQWLAAILDAVENLGLILILFNPIASLWPEIAYWCAVFKFGLIFLGLVYALYGLAVGVVTRLVRRQ
jgi:hypothetical protein